MSELDGLRWAMAEERFAGRDYRGAGRLLVDIIDGEPATSAPVCCWPGATSMPRC